MEEIWIDIKDYEGLYQVSSLGRIKCMSKCVRCRCNSTRVITERITNGCVGNGYMIVGLHKNKKIKSIRVHQIVARHFIENTENKKTVNHINGIKTDNRVENLEWATYSEQMLHAFKIGLMSYSDKQREILVNRNKSEKQRQFVIERHKKESSKIQVAGLSKYRMKIVLNTENGIFYESCTEAAINYNINNRMLSSKLSGKIKNDTSFIYA